MSFQDQLLLNEGQKYFRMLQRDAGQKYISCRMFSKDAGQKYCRMLQREHSAILSAFIKLPFAIKTFVLSNSEWLLETGFYCSTLTTLLLEYAHT